MAGIENVVYAALKKEPPPITDDNLTWVGEVFSETTDLADSSKRKETVNFIEYAANLPSGSDSNKKEFNNVMNRLVEVSLMRGALGMTEKQVADLVYIIKCINLIAAIRLHPNANMLAIAVFDGNRALPPPTKDQITASNPANMIEVAKLVVAGFKDIKVGAPNLLTTFTPIVMQIEGSINTETSGIKEGIVTQILSAKKSTDDTKKKKKEDEPSPKPPPRTPPRTQQSTGDEKDEEDEGEADDAETSKGELSSSDSDQVAYLLKHLANFKLRYEAVVKENRDLEERLSMLSTGS